MNNLTHREEVNLHEVIQKSFDVPNVENYLTHLKKH